MNFSEERWLTKARGRVLERVERGLKILVVGQDEQVQRRSHVRVSMSQPTKISVASGNAAPKIVDAEIVDISEGGCRVRCPLPLAAADAVELECNLDGATIRLAGQVVSAWPDSGQYSAGIRATSMSPGARGLISSFVIARSLATAPNRAQLSKP